MTHVLGKWTVIDIETTGIDPVYDQIIDIGFLEYEGTKLIRTYNSLVRFDGKLSHFIKKLTGIDEKSLIKATPFNEAIGEVQELMGQHLIAHNADFEESFLGHWFEEVSDGGKRESYEDSLYFLSLLFPEFNSLKLERFICDWGLADKEEHRGFQDSVDLLKVILLATHIIRQDPTKNQNLIHLFSEYQLKDYWFFKFFKLPEDELNEIAQTIDFSISEAYEKYAQIQLEKQTPDYVPASEQKFDFEFSGKNIQNIMRAEDTIKEIIPKYRYRKSQEDLSLRLGQSFKNKVHALVQAPTGTGKTLGYLVPSALFALNEKKQVLVATGTKTLQHQAMTKDVPQVRKLLGLGDKNLKIKRLIGSNNHLCELLFRQTKQEDDLLSPTRSFKEKFTDMYYDVVFNYNANNLENPITRGDLPFVMKRKVPEFGPKEDDIAVDFRSCTGQSCPFKGQCSYLKGIKEAKEANIIIGNHALMFSWPKGFPRPEYIVVDEAHKIEQETTKSYSYEVTKDMLATLNKNLTHMQGMGSLFYLLAQSENEAGSSTEVITELRTKALDTQQMLWDHIKPLEDYLESHFKKMPRYTSQYWNELPMVEKMGGNEVAIAIYNHLDSLRFILTDFCQKLLPYTTRWDPAQLKEDNLIIAYTRFESFYGSIEDLQVALEYCLNSPTPRNDYARSMKFHEQDGFSIIAAPINVGKVIHDNLLAPTASVLFTSATLGNAEGDQGVRGVEWSTGYSYTEPERRFKSGLFLPATYDYKAMTKVHLCDDTPALYDNTFVPKALEHICKLIRNIQGRSLLLFSAKTRFEVAREMLLNEFEGEIPLFIQGMGNNVVEDFKNSDNGILLGMESFGEGIDVPGDALQFVFIDKVPDLRLDYVIQQRRTFYDTNLGNEFTDYYLAHRTRSLHQKLGRLLRSEKDHGGVIIVDSRIGRWKGRTMGQFLKLMEPYDIERTSLKDACSQVEEFILNKDLN